MVAGIDMANHTLGEKQNAFFQRDEEGNAVLLIPSDKRYSSGEEITISYGDSKSASEFLFSYGFIDSEMSHTTGMTLQLTVPEDDPLGKAKEAVSSTAAAVRVSFDGQSTNWESEFVWLMCVNEEDGLQFQVAHRNDGGRELRMLYQGQDLSDDTGRLEEMLRADPLWDIFLLRALTMLQERVQAQMQRLDAATNKPPSPGDDDRDGDDILRTVKRLRCMEMTLLDQFSKDLIIQVRRACINLNIFQGLPLCIRYTKSRWGWEGKFSSTPPPP